MNLPKIFLLTVISIVLISIISFIFFNISVIKNSSVKPTSAPEMKPQITPTEDQIKVVRLDEEFTMLKGETVYLKDADFQLKLTNLIYSPCPKGVYCFWSGLDVQFEYTYAGKTLKGATFKGAFFDAFGYQVKVIDTDYKTYADIVISKNTSN